MKPAFALLTVVTLVVGVSGCGSVAGLLSPHGHSLIDGSCGHCSDCPETCRSCDTEGLGCAPGCDAAANGGCLGGATGGNAGCGLLDRCRARQYYNPGPATGTVTYPYYTIRGPRDFLASNPPPLGP